LERFYKFQIVPDTSYLERLQQLGKKFARIYTINYRGQLREVRGYTFPFALYAADEVQQFILKNGFGEYTGHGFGMLDCSNAEATVREVLLADIEQSIR
jgi:CRISPR-associated endoribonuclease Cas6